MSLRIPTSASESLGFIQSEIKPMLKEFNSLYLKDPRQADQLRGIHQTIMEKIKQLPSALSLRKDHVDAYTYLLESDSLFQKLCKMEQKIKSLPASQEIFFQPIGLRNRGANCAFNSLIQFISHIPLLKETCDLLPEEFNEFKEMLNTHLQNEKIDHRSQIDSQELRVLLHRLFYQLHPVTGEEIFSASPYNQEDPYEALMCILGRLPNSVSPLFSKLITTRQYERLNDTISPDPKRLKQTQENPNDPAAYSFIDDNDRSIKIDRDCQILIDLQNKEDVDFSTLLENFFHSRGIGGSDDAFYLENDDLLHRYKLIEEFKTFQSPPEGLLVTLKRFNHSERGDRHKIHTPVPVPFTLELPPSAFAHEANALYELTGFIQHRGATHLSGHYIAYLKIGRQWIEYNDDLPARTLSNAEVKFALRGTNYFHFYSRIDSFLQTHETASSETLNQAFLACAKHQNQVDVLNHCISVFNNKYPSFEKLPSAFSEIEDHLKNDLYFFVWISAGIPDSLDYGKKRCEYDVEIVNSIFHPFISSKGGSLLEQLYIREKEWQSYLNLNKLSLQLDVLSEMLNDITCPQNACQNFLSGIDQEMDGVLICDKLKNVSFDNQNMLQQTIHEVKKRANEAYESYLQERFETFYGVMPDSSISNEQLKYLFLNLPAEVKDSMSLSVWVDSGKPDIPGYGEKKILEDVRRILSGYYA